jgi:hypothetical protein
MFARVSPSPDIKIIVLLLSRFSIALEELHVISNIYLTFAKKTLSVHNFFPAWIARLGIEIHQAQWSEQCFPVH